MIEQGQIYAGRVSEGQAGGGVEMKPAVVRVQHMSPELCQVVRLDSSMMGREGFIKTARLADSFRLASQGPEFTSEQVAGWLSEVEQEDA